MQEERGRKLTAKERAINEYHTAGARVARMAPKRLARGGKIANWTHSIPKPSQHNSRNGEC